MFTSGNSRKNCMTSVIDFHLKIFHRCNPIFNVKIDRVTAKISNRIPNVYLYVTRMVKYTPNRWVCYCATIWHKTRIDFPKILRIFMQSSEWATSNTSQFCCRMLKILNIRPAKIQDNFRIQSILRRFKHSSVLGLCLGKVYREKR